MEWKADPEVRCQFLAISLGEHTTAKERPQCSVVLGCFDIKAVLVALYNLWIE
jgi:hypothetical protein